MENSIVRQIYADRLGNSEHELIANLPVADGFAILLPARIHAFRQPFTRRRIRFATMPRTAAVAPDHGFLTVPLRVKPRCRALSSSNH